MPITLPSSSTKRPWISFVCKIACVVDDGVVALVFEVVWVVMFLWFNVVVSWDFDVCVSVAFWVDTLVDGRDVWTEEVDDVFWDTAFGAVIFSFEVWSCADDVCVE